MNLIFEERSESELKNQVKKVFNAVIHNEPYVIRTSGTTGTPKKISSDLKKALEKKKPGKHNEKWLLTYGPERWAGISVILHVIKSKASLYIPKSLEFKEIIETGIKYQTTHVSMTPSMFRSLMLSDSEQKLDNIPFSQVTFGGEAATQSVLDLAAKIWPKSRISHVYASTEFGDISAVSDGLEGFPSYKFDKYSFTQDNELLVNGLNTGDIWEKKNERYYFVGRKEEIINVGGNKVSPLKIEEFAISKGAKFARAFGIKSPIMGSLVGLEYVGDIDEKNLMIEYRKIFSKFECPVSIKRIDDVVLTNAGKTRRLL